jgi:quinol monooxygenase YgiN
LDIDVVVRELPVHKELTLKETGCLAFSVTEDESNNHKFNVYEEFVNQAAFEHHQERVKSSKWGEVTKNVERHYVISNRELTSVLFIFTYIVNSLRLIGRLLPHI